MHTPQLHAAQQQQQRMLPPQPQLGRMPPPQQLPCWPPPQQQQATQPSNPQTRPSSSSRLALTLKLGWSSRFNNGCSCWRCCLSFGSPLPGHSTSTWAHCGTSCPSPPMSLPTTNRQTILCVLGQSCCWLILTTATPP
jgi:hypothetical protein